MTASRRIATLSILASAALAIAPAKNRFSEWGHYQKGYVRLIRGRGEAVTLQRHFHAEGGPDPGNELRPHQRMTAQQEEIVIRADLL